MKNITRSFKKTDEGPPSSGLKEFFHLTSAQAWEEIQESGQMDANRRMIPLNFSDKTIPQQAHEGAIFGLTEEDSESWWTEEYNKDVPVIETVLKDIRNKNGQVAVLKIKTPPDTYVADWGVHLASDYNGQQGTDRDKLIQVKAHYAESLTPIAQYKGGHRLPEVVCFSDIPVENIELVGTYDVEAYVNEKRQKFGKGPSPTIWYKPSGR
ncbi:MAG: hypothetical protein K9G62_08060 [Alphaproteobacteria bacterium]|nr:hypothetical protein [Alphaproteobacteria bacterium]